MAAVVPFLAVAPDQKSTGTLRSSCWENFHQHTRYILLKDGSPSQVPAVPATLTNTHPQKQGYPGHCQPSQPSQPSQPTGAWGKIKAPCFQLLSSGTFYYIANVSYHIYLFLYSLPPLHRDFSSCNREKNGLSLGKHIHWNLHTFNTKLASTNRISRKWVS